MLYNALDDFDFNNFKKIKLLYIAISEFIFILFILSAI